MRAELIEERDAVLVALRGALDQPKAERNHLYSAIIERCQVRPRLFLTDF